MKKRIKRIMTSITLMMMVASTTVFASIPNPGVKAKSWFMDNLEAVFSIVLGIIGIVLLKKRQFLFAIGAFLFAGVGALLIFNGVDFAKIIADIFFSFFK